MYRVVRSLLNAFAPVVVLLCVVTSTAKAQSCPAWRETLTFVGFCPGWTITKTLRAWDEGPPGGIISYCQVSCEQTQTSGSSECDYCDTTLLYPPCTSSSGSTGCEDQCDGSAPESGSCNPPEQGDCENWRADPVHVGTNAFISEEREDVAFSGTSVPLRFARHFTSVDRWPSGAEMGTNRLAPGWFHTYDERLFGTTSAGRPEPLVSPSSGSSALSVVHRDGARGQSFTCGAPHDPAADFSCASSDGSEDVLLWLSASSTWSHRRGDGLWTTFDADGRLLGASDRAGHGWSVTYHASGAEEGLIDYVEDHIGRRLVFVWALGVGPAHLVRLEDGAGATLATYSVGTNEFLLATTSAIGSESYTYGELAGSTLRQFPVLEEITRDGVAETTVEYEHNTTYNFLTGRVRSVIAASGSYEFRFRGDSDNLCNDAFGYDETRTTMVVDRSVPVSPAACSLDSHCASTEACSSEGLCRPFTCQQYVQPVGATAVDFTAVGDISGNCPCGGATHRDFAELSNGGVRATSYTARDGTVVSLAYDAQARLVERCIGDADLDGDPATCASTGAVWNSWAYDTNWPSRVALEQRRSRLWTGVVGETEYDYDATTGRLTAIRRRGYTRDLSGATIGPVEEVTTYVWDTQGRLSEEQGPASGERTVYTYWPSGSGTSSGLVHYIDRYATATASLRTTLEDYTSTGRPRRVIDPSGLVRDLTYSPTGQLLTATVAGRTTTLGYDAAGRLATVSEASGRRFELGYDGAGRLEQVDTYDSSGPGWSDRVRYEYDAAGRRTDVHVEIADPSGGVYTVALTWSATYDNHGDASSETVGPQGPTDYDLDPAGMGYLAGLTRGDGDEEDYGSDLLGRMTSVQRTFSAGSTSSHLLYYANESGSALNVGGSLPTRVTEPGGQQRDYTYDDFGRLVESSAAEWGTAQWRWVDGRLTEERDPEGKRTVYTRDRLGRVTLIDRDADNPTLRGQDYQFDYDNGDGAVACTTTYYGCVSRVGRLARVGIEYHPGLFWSMYYDYEPLGRVGTEVYPDGRTLNVEYNADGLPTRVHLPARPGDTLRYDYGAADGDEVDATELVAITHERSGGDLVNWFDEISRDRGGGLITGVTMHDNASIVPYVQWGDDGRVECLWNYRRTSGGGAAGVLDRCYEYAADGMAQRHDSLVGGDGERAYFRDGANRLTCASSDIFASSCPTGSTLLERYSYDVSDNRVDAETPSGTRSYLNLGNVIWDEYLPGGRTIWYDYMLYAAGARRWDEEISAPETNGRWYSYDGEGRLTGIQRSTANPNVSGSPQHTHLTTILYDHRSRPLVVADYDTNTGDEQQWWHYWSLDDSLLNRVHYPDITDASTYVVDTQVPLPNPGAVPAFFTGRMRTEFTSGAAGTEEYMYYTSGPEGRPMAAYSFDLTTGLTNEVWRAQYTPFGELAIETTSDPARYRALHLFPGQIPLEGSEVGWWAGGAYTTGRAELQLNRWRVYDPRVGQYLQPEPMLVQGSLFLMHPYAYGMLSPLDYVDLDGRDPVVLTWGGVTVTIGFAEATAGVTVLGWAGVDVALLVFFTAAAAVAAGNVSNDWDNIAQGARNISIGLAASDPEFVCAYPSGTWANDRSEPIPMPTEEECDQEWAEAYERCEKRIAGARGRRGGSRSVTGPYTSVPDCARGLVIEACGGNRVEY